MATGRAQLKTLPDDAPHLLVVDDDRRIRELLSRFLMSEGYRVTTVESAAEARAKLEGVSLEQALQQSGGNQTRAAQRLGISRDTLRYRLKKYGIGG